MLNIMLHYTLRHAVRVWISLCVFLPQFRNEITCFHEVLSVYYRKFPTRIIFAALH